MNRYHMEIKEGSQLRLHVCDDQACMLRHVYLQSDYDALAAELAAQIEDCTVNYNQRVILTKRVDELETALHDLRGRMYTGREVGCEMIDKLFTSAAETFVKQEPSRGDPEDDKKGHP